MFSPQDYDYKSYLTIKILINKNLNNKFINILYENAADIVDYVVCGRFENCVLHA